MKISEYYLQSNELKLCEILDTLATFAVDPEKKNVLALKIEALYAEAVSESFSHGYDAGYGHCLDNKEQKPRP